MTMTDKEVRAIAIKEMTYADMIAIGIPEAIAAIASWKARCAFEASWNCAVEKTCEFFDSISCCEWVEDIEVKELVKKYKKFMEE